MCLNRHISMSMYYAEPLAPQIFRSSYSQEKKREADIEHLTSQIGLLAEKVRESSKLKPEVASKTLSTLSKMEKSSFNKTLDEETCADMIDGKPPSPDVIPKGILLNKPDDKQTVENKERKKKKGITRYFLATSLKQHKKDFEALKTTNKRKEQNARQKSDKDKDKNGEDAEKDDEDEENEVPDDPQNQAKIKPRTPKRGSEGCSGGLSERTSKKQ